MKSESDNLSPIFNFPVLLILTSILCLASYHVFGLNTTIGVATGSTALAFFSLNRKPKN
jgi:hypothetical protein